MTDRCIFCRWYEECEEYEAYTGEEELFTEDCIWYEALD